MLVPFHIQIGSHIAANVSSFMNFLTAFKYKSIGGNSVEEVNIASIYCQIEGLIKKSCIETQA